MRRHHFQCTRSVTSWIYIFSVTSSFSVYAECDYIFCWCDVIIFSVRGVWSHWFCCWCDVIIVSVRGVWFYISLMRRHHFQCTRSVILYFFDVTSSFSVYAECDSIFLWRDVIIFSVRGVWFYISLMWRHHFQCTRSVTPRRWWWTYIRTATTRRGERPLPWPARTSRVLYVSRP